MLWTINVNAISFNLVDNTRNTKGFAVSSHFLIGFFSIEVI